MGKIKRMDQVKLIIETYLRCGSIKGTSRRLQVSRNTVRQYVRLGKDHYPDLSKIFTVPESELFKVFYCDKSEEPGGRESVFQDQLSYWLKELRRVGVTRHLLWQEYRVQIEFAGKKMRWVDLSSGEVHECEVLLAVMPHSHYTFAIALASQKVQDFVHGLNQLFRFLGKCPQVILCDNLKSYVKKADRYDPDFNDLCVQLAAHYQLDLQATRVAKPKDKASVENMVKTAYTRIYAPLRNETFHSLEELNEAIAVQLSIHNTKPFQKKPGCRKEVFEQFEFPVMKDLPGDLFEISKTVTAKVQRNYHIFVGEEKNFYSVPYQHAGKKATVIYNAKKVEVYIGNQRVATHSRLSRHDQYCYRTEDTHLPKNHSEWKKAQGYDATYFLAQAEKIGPATQWAIGQVLLSRIKEVQSYNSCKGILYLGKKHTNERLERACLRCQPTGKTNYSMLKRILQLNLDQVDQRPDLFSTPEHDNIRGPQAYQ